MLNALLGKFEEQRLRPTGSASRSQMSGMHQDMIDQSQLGANQCDRKANTGREQDR
jgi:hypothetical protein